MTDYNVFKLHAILYAKSHYKQDRKLTGLRAIAGHYSLTDPQYVSDDHLLHFTMMLMEEYAPKTSANDIIFGTFKDAWMWRSRKRTLRNPTNISKLDIVKSILLVLRHLRVDQLPQLPKADAKVATLTRKQ